MTKPGIAGMAGEWSGASHALRSIAVLHVRDATGRREEHIAIDSGGRFQELPSASSETQRSVFVSFKSDEGFEATWLKLSEVVSEAPLLFGLVATTGYGLSGPDPWGAAVARTRESSVATLIFRIEAGAPSRREPSVPEASAAGLTQYAASLHEPDYVPALSVALPALTGDLVDDVCTLCGLTRVELAHVIGGVSERAVYEWRGGNVPERRRPALEALRAIGLLLHAGLGARGVRRWLDADEPPTLNLVRAGRLDEAIDRARRAATSPAT
jgi:hypothetical protein